MEMENREPRTENRELIRSPPPVISLLISRRVAFPIERAVLLLVAHAAVVAVRGAVVVAARGGAEAVAGAAVLRAVVQPVLMSDLPRLVHAVVARAAILPGRIVATVAVAIAVSLAIAVPITVTIAV